ncbi:hypothetical protein [Chitinophaga qingshengii]|uniref:Uncharacterized protein n=1 Tax=Chitinophaga qingshengii TaxID=1569794 RepID=A0ABR7TNG0_9BACT|nr:hypothetical protein [Chitinophaga qingshengii]MBC9931046.1 hypothetical protein [Chitinophaga qingshengii]
MIHLYTSRAKFDKRDGAWSQYIEWSRLTQLTELVSLDTGLNEVLVEADRHSDEYWQEIVLEGCYPTGFFRTLDYVLKHTNHPGDFNLLTVVIEPAYDCSFVPLDGYEFLGYDLLDQYYDTSALSNCGGFDETFLPEDLNNVGLIDNYEKAYTIKKKLRENNPGEDHADTNVIAIWRSNKPRQVIE